MKKDHLKQLKSLLHTVVEEFDDMMSNADDFGYDWLYSKVEYTEDYINRIRHILDKYDTPK